jgi:hypothetical protein
LSEIVPAKWRYTADAIKKLLSDNDEWCRLNDRFHRGLDIKPDEKPRTEDRRRRIARYIKERRCKAFYAKQNALLEPVYSDVMAEKLAVVLLTRTDSGEWIEHPLPAKYLDRWQLFSALSTGQAGKLTLGI